MADLQVAGSWEGAQPAHEEDTIEGPGDDEVDADDAVDRSSNGSVEALSASGGEGDDEEPEQRCFSETYVTGVNEVTAASTDP